MSDTAPAVAEPVAASTRRRLVLPMPLLVTLGLVVLAVAVAVLRTSSPVTVGQAVLTGLLLGGVYGLVALGLTLIFGVLDIVNFAHGALLTVAMYVTYTLSDRFGLDPYLSLLVAVPVLFLLGAVLQRGLIDRTLGQPLENQLLLTLGIALLLENALLLGYGGEPRSVRPSYDRPVDVLTAVADLSRILAFVGALAIAGLLFFLLQRTRLGTAIRAVAANPRGAQLVGVDVRRIYTLTFAIGTACAGAAGVLVVPFVTVEPTIGELFNIVAFVVVVLGGLGSVPGAVVGGLVVGLTEQLGGLIFPGQNPLLSVFAVFVLVLFLRPQGIFGRTP